jgi:hypothetical protein
MAAAVQLQNPNFIVPTQHYFVPPGNNPGWQPSPVQNWPARVCTTNNLSQADCALIVQAWRANGTIAQTPTGRDYCPLATTGQDKHAQGTIPNQLRAQLSYNKPGGGQWKELVQSYLLETCK